MANDLLRRACLLGLAAAASTLFAAAPITIVVTDPPGAGFNDRTPAAPAGGNPGTTVGEQRLNALRYAAEIWSSALDSPFPTRVRANFEPLHCTETSALGGSGGPINVYTVVVPSTEFLPNVWYPNALANKLSGKILDPGTEEIVLHLNLSLGQPGCAAGSNWYYGLDANTPADGVNMASLALHEMGHGFGFLPLINPNGSRLGSLGDIYSQYVLDTTTGKTWNQMSDADRMVSITNAGHVVWNGINGRTDAGKVLRHGRPLVSILEPASLAGDLSMIGTATFGAELDWPGLAGEVVAAVDAADEAGPSTADACSPLQNAFDVAGRIALADRGGCNFVDKALNAQAAGAIGLLVADNVEEELPSEMYADNPTVTLPLIHVRMADANALKSALAALQKVTVRLTANPDLVRGGDAENRPLLYSPSTPATLSPIGHFDESGRPSQLMQPVILPDVEQALGLPHDLTLSVLRDLGWFSDFDGVPDGIDQCPGSDRGATVQIQACDTGVKNTTFATGCRISDYYKTCAAETAGGYAACADSVSRQLMSTETITAADAARIQACAVRAGKQEEQ